MWGAVRVQQAPASAAPDVHASWRVLASNIMGLTNLQLVHPDSQDNGACSLGRSLLACRATVREKRILQAGRLQQRTDTCERPKRHCTAAQAIIPCRYENERNVNITHYGIFSASPHIYSSRWV
jgi:hypothetical protein